MTSPNFYNTPIPRDRYVGCVSIASHPVWYEFARERNLDCYELSVLHQIFAKAKNWQLSSGQISNSWNVSRETVVEVVKSLIQKCPELKTSKGEWGLIVDAQALYDHIYQRIIDSGDHRF